MATNAERAAKIREATLQAVRERNQLGDAAIEQLVTIYDDAGEAIAEQIQRVSGGGDNLLTLDNLQQILTEIRQQMAELEKQRDGLLYRKISQAAVLGAKPFAGELPPSQLFAINHQAVSFVRALVASDGLQLSDRLWRLNRNATAALADHIQFAVINGESAHQAMLRTMGSGQGVPHDVAMAYNGAKAGALSRKVRSLMTGEADPANGKGVVYQAERLFRTEINRAHGEAYMASAFQTDGVAGVRFMLSVNHRVRDVCDTHATADKYGLGPGVYPSRETCPWPAHPNTLSYVEVVFDWEVGADNKNAGTISGMNRDAITSTYFNDNSTVERDDEIEISGAPLSDKNLIRLGGAPDNSRVRVVRGDYGPVIEVHNALFQTPAIRAIYEMEDGYGLYLYNEMFVLKPENQAKGIGARSLAMQVREAKSLGFSGLSLFGDGSPNGELNGYYTWARLGFDATLSPHQQRQLPATLYGAKKLSDLMASKAGQDWWRQNGIPTEMDFDLTDDSPSMTILSKYLIEKGIVL